MSSWQCHVLGWLPMVAGVALMGCSRSGTGETATASLQTMTAQELRAVATDVSIDLPLQASAYAWRDFLPGPAATGRTHGLMVSVQIRGGVVPPKALACDGMYLVSGDSVFVAPPAEQRAGDGPGAVECILRGGPEWPIGASVQVIIGVSAGVQRTLIRRETTIDATS